MTHANNDIHVRYDVTIPENELEITASRASGPGGQHVNKASTRVTVRWNVKKSVALTDEQKERVLQKLQTRLTTEGDLLINNSTSRSRDHNKKMALAQLANDVRKALFVPKRRMKTRVPKTAQESRLHEKARRGHVKKLRKKEIREE